MKKILHIRLMLSSLLILVLGSAAVAEDDADALALLETQGGVTELLDEIHTRDTALMEKDKEIAALKAAAQEAQVDISEIKGTTLEEALAQRDEALKARDAALAARDEALKNRDAAALESIEGMRTLEERLAALQREIPLKDARIAQLEMELDATSKATRQDLLKLAYNLACIYKAGHQYTKAEAEFLKALAIDPNDPGVHYNLGILYDDNLGNASKALHHYQSFLDLAPHDKDAPNVIEWMSALQ
jgi:tetratricopeptide (TPR) repeat protein